MNIFFTSLIGFLVLDGLWFGLVAHRFFAEWLAPIARLKEGSIAPLWIPAALVYLLLAIGLSYFVYPLIKDSDLLTAFMIGALFGLVVYGVFDLTNFTFLKDWPLKVVIVDMLWGAFATGAVAVIVRILIR